MRVSPEDALQLLHKWNSDEPPVTLFVVLEELRPVEPPGELPLPPRFVCRLRGQLTAFSREKEALGVSTKEGGEMVVSFLGATLEYEDWREAPPEDRERAKASLSGWVIITSDFWRCTLFEPKD